MGPWVKSQLFPTATKGLADTYSKRLILNQEQNSLFEDHGALELGGTPGDEPTGPLKQVGPQKQESAVHFGDHGAPGASWGP